MINHKSDCAVHNMPAMPRGECDCGAEKHPAIVALAKARYERDCDTDANGKIVPWDALPSWLREELTDLSARDYAAVLKDLMEPSEAMFTAWGKLPEDQIVYADNKKRLNWREDCKIGHQVMLRARAREIGVEIE